MNMKKMMAFLLTGAMLLGSGALSAFATDTDSDRNVGLVMQNEDQVVENTGGVITTRTQAEIAREVQFLGGIPTVVEPTDAEDERNPYSAEKPVMDRDVQDTLAGYGLLHTDGSIDLDALMDIPSADGEADRGIATIIGTDGRSKVSNVLTSPYKRIVFLLCENPNGSLVRGTGFVVGSDLIATAGHCVYSKDSAKGIGWMKNVTVLAGLHSNVRTGTQSKTGVYATAAKKTLVTANSWINSSAAEGDWGLVKCSTSIGSSTGTLGFRQVSSTSSYTKPGSFLRVAGYPGDKDYYMYQMTGTVQSYSSTDRIFYTIDTMGGQSGAPIMDSGNYAIGIHAKGSTSGNSGAALISSIYNTILNYR